MFGFSLLDVVLLGSVVPESFAFLPLLEDVRPTLGTVMVDFDPFGLDLFLPLYFSAFCWFRCLMRPWSDKIYFLKASSLLDFSAPDRELMYWLWLLCSEDFCGGSSRFFALSLYADNRRIYCCILVEMRLVGVLDVDNGALLAEFCDVLRIYAVPGLDSLYRASENDFA